MNHNVVTENLADYLEGDLALDARALVDAHLDGCVECAREVREMQQTIRLLRAMPEPEVPPMIAANVMRRIRAGEAEPTFFERIQRALGGVLEPSFVMPAAGLAVAALVIAVVRGNPPFASEPERSIAPAAPPQSAATQATNEGPRDGSPRIPEAAQPFGVPSASEMVAADPVDASGPDAAAPTNEVVLAEASPLAPPSAEASPEDEIGFSDGETIELAATAVESRLGARSAIAEQVPATRAARAMGSRFGDPGLAQGFASDVVGPPATHPSRRLGAFPVGEMGAELAMVEPLGFAGADSAAAPARPRAVPGSEDPRDAWLARALEDPTKFASFIAQQNLAEQELWVARLGERAIARGLMSELIAALREVGDERSTWLADDFAAQAKAAATAEADAAAGDGTDSGEATRER